MTVYVSTLYVQIILNTPGVI